ncbi:MAG: class I SAM-dependent methyltransferase [Rubrobacteraceae bacterium]|nr:class I SAM-dependent methyltransferase [Rubrobacteraceae bacterium]
MERRHPRKFDPSRAGNLDRPERQRFLPNDRVLDLLDLAGDETVVDYGAGTGTLTIPLAHRLPRGTVHAIDENPQMIERLRERLAAEHLPNVSVHHISDDAVPLPDGSADRILAVNLLHELEEKALREMQRLLTPSGFLLVVDWNADVERDAGPPADEALSPEQGRAFLASAGFSCQTLDAGFPYHFVFRCPRP